MSFAIVVLWLIIGTVVALKGDPMERSARLAQLYGYTICLIAIVTGLFSVPSIFNGVFDLTNPLQAEAGFGSVKLSSIEAYLASHEEQQAGRTNRDTASVETLRARYVALRDDQLDRVRFNATKSLVASSVLLIVAVLLFAIHWRWLRRLRAEATAATPSPGSV